MTLRDLFTDKSIWNQYGDMDVYIDCIDDVASAWCGTLMTEAGLEHYGDDLLGTEISIIEDKNGACIECWINERYDYSKRWRRIKALFDEAAGFLGCEEYDMWFMDDYELETPEPVFDDHKALVLLIEHTPIDRIKEAIAEDERLLPFLESIGYNTKNLKEA